MKTNLKQTFIVKLVGLMFCLSSWTVQAATDYAIHDLGTLARESSFPTAINNNNLILGVVTEQKKEVKFIWEAGKELLYIDDSLINYRPKINNNNVIAGIFLRQSKFWLFNDNFFKHITLFNIDGSEPEDIGVPSEWEIKSFASWQTPSIWDEKDLGLIDYNDRGQLLVANAVDLSKASQFVLWNNGAYVAIDSGALSMAYGINNNGLILGRKWIKDEGHDVPMLVLYNWEKGETFEIMKDINLIRKQLNDAGEVIMTKKIQEDACQGFIWDLQQGLQSLNDFCPIARNNNHQMVGIDHDTFYFWDNGELIELNEALNIGRADALWSQIVSISGLNDNGWMIGQGVFDEKKHAFALVPQ